MFAARAPSCARRGYLSPFSLELCYLLCWLMSVAPSIETDPERGESKCLARSVTNILAQGPALEAVTVDRVRKVISVATLGRADVPKITERVAATIQRAENGPDKSCGLLRSE